MVDFDDTVICDASGDVADVAAAAAAASVVAGPLRVTERGDRGGGGGGGRFDGVAGNGRSASGRRFAMLTVSASRSSYVGCSGPCDIVVDAIGVAALMFGLVATGGCSFTR